MALQEGNYLTEIFNKRQVLETITGLLIMNNVAKFESLFKELDVYLLESEKRAQSRVKRFNEELASANDGRQPTIDSLGRMHAPCDNYFFDGRLFLAGEFLHVPEDIRDAMADMYGSKASFDSTKYLLRAKIKGLDSLLPALRERLGDLAKIGNGRVWDEEGSCYIYVETKRKALIAIFENYAAQQREEAKTSKGAAPSGRKEVCGKVLKLRIVETGFGRQLKMAVLLSNSSTCYGSVPASIANEIVVGGDIKFSATFNVSEEDPTHSFYKRPSKASINKPS